MTGVESKNALLGLSRLDIVQRGIGTGEPVEPIQVPELVRNTVPTRPTNKQRRELKFTWPGLKELAQQELSR